MHPGRDWKSLLLQGCFSAVPKMEDAKARICKEAGPLGGGPKEGLSGRLDYQG